MLELVLFRYQADRLVAVAVMRSGVALAARAARAQLQVALFRAAAAELVRVALLPEPALAAKFGLNFRRLMWLVLQSLKMASLSVLTKLITLHSFPLKEVRLRCLGMKRWPSRNCAMP